MQNYTRSSNEPKDKQEKPFALAFVPLRNADGTAIADGQHELMVYKVSSYVILE